MNNENHRPTPNDILDEAIGAWRSAPAASGPPAELVAATVEAMENRLAGLTKLPVRQQRPRRQFLRYAGYVSLATAATVLIGALLSEFGGGPAAAFDKSLENVAKTEAVRFRLRTTFSDAEQRTNAVIVRGNKLRVDDVLWPGTAWIIDWDEKQALLTDAANRAYQTVEMRDGGIAPVDFIGLNVRDELLSLKSQKAQLAGAETVAGETADRYVINGGKAFHTEGDWEVWVGRNSKLPVKVTVTIKLHGRQTIQVYESFDWNPKTDASTFSIDPPAEFEEKTILRLFPSLPSRNVK